MKKIITGLLLTSLSLMSCTPAIIPDTFVRYVNTSADSLGMKIYNKGIRVPSSPIVDFKGAFPSLSTYSMLKTGALTYSLCPELVQDCPSAVKDKNINLAAEAQTTVFLVGTTDIADDGGNDPRPIEVLALESQTPAPAAGKAKIRVLHAATPAAAKTIDLYILAPNAALTGLTIPLNYKGTSSYNTFDAGTYRISATLPGVTNSTVVKSDPITLEAGKIYTAVLINPDVNGVGTVFLTDK
jgi:hypothetical protein